MAAAEKYAPGPASIAHVEKDGEKWTLVLVREFAHPPAKVWKALTDPADLREWAPFDADRNLGAVGTAKLSTVGAPMVSEAKIRRAEAPKSLEYNWGEFNMRWELAPNGKNGTRLTLWTNITRQFMAMGAAGWQICFDVLDRFLAAHPIGRMVGPPVMHFEGWQRLNADYSKQFGLDAQPWSKKQ